VVKVWGKGTGQASFNFNVENGKGTLQLGFQLGLPHDHHVHPQQLPQRKGPSRRERDRRRAAEFQARKASEEETDPVSATTEDNPRDTKESDDKSTMSDEFCSDKSFVENDLEKDCVVEEILVKLDSEEGCNTNDDVKNLIEYKLKIVGIDMKELKINRDEPGDDVACSIKIKAMNSKNIDVESFPFRNWKIVTR
jgi:hypothetical protein